MHLRLSLSNSKVKQANLVSSKTPSHQRQICFHQRKFYFILLRDCLYCLFCSCYLVSSPNPSLLRGFDLLNFVECSLSLKNVLLMVAKAMLSVLSDLSNWFNSPCPLNLEGDEILAPLRRSAGVIF